MIDPSSGLEGEGEGVEIEDTWEWWNRLHTLCSNCKNMALGESAYGISKNTQDMIIL